MLPNTNKGTPVKLLSVLKEKATIPGLLLFSSYVFRRLINSTGMLLISKKKQEVTGEGETIIHMPVWFPPRCRTYHTDRPTVGRVVPWSGDNEDSSKCTGGTFVADPGVCPCSWNLYLRAGNWMTGYSAPGRASS